jgi:DNA-binding CsgD family transcriptional regulator
MNLYSLDGMPMMAAFTDKDHALRFVDRLITFLNGLYEKRDAITTNYKRYKPLSVLYIYKLLPKTNCKECGFQTCMAFAGALRIEQTMPDKCPHFARPIMEKAVYPVYDDTGRMVSTIEIDIDTSKAKSDQEKYEKHITELRTKLAEITEEKQTTLTHREIEVLKWVADGATNGEISDILSISPHTVKSHVIHIFNKLGVNDRTQAAVWAARQNII